MRISRSGNGLIQRHRRHCGRKVFVVFDGEGYARFFVFRCYLTQSSGRARDDQHPADRPPGEEIPAGDSASGEPRPHNHRIASCEPPDDLAAHVDAVPRTRPDRTSPDP